MALVFSAKPLIARAEAAASRGEISETAAIEIISTDEGDFAPPLPGPDGNRSPVQTRARNPYRLGRRRG
jgi:hypothetical protein